MDSQYVSWFPWSIGIIIAIFAAFNIYRSYQHRVRSRNFLSEERYFKAREYFFENERNRIAHLDKREPEKKTITEIIEEKKKRFSGITSASFHFVDKGEIENYYNDTFREPTLESLVSEITGEINSEVKGSLPQILESKIGSRDINKWISTIKLPETSLSGMFIKYQKEAIIRDEITLGLEELDVELNELQKFDSAIKKLTEEYDFNLDSDNLENQRSKLRQKAAEVTLAKLESAAGWVVIEGKFHIGVRDEMYELSLTHPVNEFLFPNHAEVKILLSLPIDSIESRYSGNYNRSIGRAIPLRVFGKVWQPIDRDTDIWELQITPLAVYQ